MRVYNRKRRQPDFGLEADTADFPLHLRRNSLYTPIASTSSESLQQVRQPEQLFKAKQRSPGSKLYERIHGSGIGAARQDRLQLALGIVEVNAMLTPVLAVVEQFELTLEQRMEGMGYAEMFLPAALTRCN